MVSPLYCGKVNNRLGEKAIFGAMWPMRQRSGGASTRLGRARTGVSAAILLLACVPGLAPDARAAASAWAETPQTRVRLISAASGLGSERRLALGLQFRMQPGWKIYWRSPGDAGFPPSIDWSESENLSGAVMSWPAPQRFTVLGFNTLGYKREVVLPIEAMATEPGSAVKLRATVDYLTCDEICVPHQAKLALDLPAGPAQSTPFTYIIDTFRARVPDDGVASGLAIERVEVRRAGAERVLVVAARAREPFARPDLFVEGPALLEFGRPEVETDEGGRVARFELPIRALATPAPILAGAPLTLTLVDGARALETTEVAAPAARAVPAPRFGFLAILGLALLGGLILNLMPCVLPVLSLKLLGVVGHGGGDRGEVRRRFLASAAGIVASFLALAGVLAALKLAGATVGWGIQFQSPAFLVAMSLVLALFAANLWGVFELRLPTAVADRLARATGHDPDHHHSLGGDFLTGVFAALLATPCSAPFLGTAVGFALSRGGLEIAAVFLMRGVGLAAPYLAVAALPRLATALPRPGPWMVKLRIILGFALAVTAVWLLTVLAAHKGADAAYGVGALLAALVALLWLRLRIRDWLGDWARRAGPVAVVALGALAFWAPGQLAGGGVAPAGSSAEAGWVPFDLARISGLVAQGKTVMVDVTADWCITCKANKELVLRRGEVAARLGSPDVVAMIADWTRPNDGITSYLASFGRYGIPFNVIYGPRAPLGVVLPELLTPGAVLAAFERAGASDAKALARD